MNPRTTAALVCILLFLALAGAGTRIIFPAETIREGMDRIAVTVWAVGMAMVPVACGWIIAHLFLK